MQQTEKKALNATYLIECLKIHNILMIYCESCQNSQTYLN